MLQIVQNMSHIEPVGISFLTTSGAKFLLLQYWPEAVKAVGWVHDILKIRHSK